MTTRRTAKRNCSFCGWFSQFLRDFETAIREASPEELAQFRASLRDKMLRDMPVITDRVQ